MAIGINSDNFELPTTALGVGRKELDKDLSDLLTLYSESMSDSEHDVEKFGEAYENFLVKYSSRK
jgi:hypothetical protein